MYNRADERRRNFMLILCRAYCNFFFIRSGGTNEKRSARKSEDTRSMSSSTRALHAESMYRVDQILIEFIQTY
uniref:Uncharacterized protein n=1 Tax=Trichogramma kaykai TaxID=54128 RepID=A0ABD2WS79_9HYME